MLFPTLNISQATNIGANNPSQRQSSRFWKIQRQDARNPTVQLPQMDLEEFACTRLRGVGKLADQVLQDPIYKDRIEWEFAENVLNGNRSREKREAEEEEEDEDDWF
ncbi:hypothetical protein K1719_003958 [Acacia pycnantha]|nr:hypothetical protein K1719_003958 [Acacia pycnantha]